MDAADAKKTPLFDAHKVLKAKMVPFGGWMMPVSYASALAEHKAVREKCGIFDVSHMGEVFVRGPSAESFLQKMTVNDITRLGDGNGQYTAILDDKGGMIDDLIIYRLKKDEFLICVNASNADKDFAWMKDRSQGCVPVNRSPDYAQIAVQGPKAFALVQRLASKSLQGVDTYRFTTGQVAGVDAIISRTGYTGEDGFELYIAPDKAEKLWFALLEEGKGDKAVPAGLGARDSLRTEMKYALYGNDIDDTHTPLEAGLGWITKLDKADFIGKAALVKQKAEGITRKLVGFELTEAGIPRSHYPILKDGQKVGEVTSGTMGPTVKKPIGIGYVPTALAAEGSTFHVEIRGRPVAAKVVKTPFLKKG